MTKSKEEKDEKKPFNYAGDNFFVFPKLERRRLYPVNFVLMGVLGDLCLTRVNNEIFDYKANEQLKPLDQVFMCDVLPGPESKPIDFFKELYKKCDGYDCLWRYFQKSFLKRIETEKRQQNINTPKLFDQLLIEVFEEEINNRRYRKIIDLLEPLKSILTPLGLFLVENYKTSGTPAEIITILSEKPDEMDWIFYIGIPPTEYRNVIDSIKDYFFNPMNHENPSGPARVFLLEKPLQENYDNASKFSKYLNDLSNLKNLRFHFFAVDHYAAKWTLWQLPLLNIISNFINFIDKVDEIIIELIEDRTIPDIRLNYMAKTGLFFDMMPHALIPIQFLFAGKTVKCVEVKKLVVSYYKGYENEVENWKNMAGKPNTINDIRYETYFSLQLTLMVSDPGKPQEEARKIDVFIRSGKGLIKERKRVILKRREDKDKKINLGRFIIDIKEDKFEPSTGTPSLPPHILNPEAASMHIRGHARILYDVMEYLSTLHNGAAERSKVVELLSVENAAEIIGCIEKIKDRIVEKKQWPKEILEMKPYEIGKELILDDDKEKKFLYP
jgi:hypothetical protein